MSKSNKGILVGLGLLAGAYSCISDKIQQNKDEKKKYVITAKADKKIIYTSIEDTADLHVMEFRESDTDLLLYNYIDIGDTIDGNVARLSQPTIMSSKSIRGKSNDFYPLVISHVNGKDIDAVKKQVAYNAEIARRDSIIREMKQGQR